MQKVLVIVGPTASGKSALAVALAKKFNGEVVSADSRQVYRGLDIGTGKITRREMRGVPHHLLDVASTTRKFSAGDFAERARAAIQTISKRHKLPVIAGGTGFYIDALIGRISLPEVKADPALRVRLQKKTAAQLYVMLKQRDPKRARAMRTPSERNNKVRLIRALEIATSKKVAAQQAPAYETLWLGIKPSQRELERRIRMRLTTRIRQGLIAEGRRLHAHGLSYKRMEELGLEYRSLSRLLQNKLSKKAFEEELFRDIRRYAKKQLAYWKRNRGIRWYAPERKPRIMRHVAAWLKSAK
ncbi:MAG TPA: tRNA (adenosine(37)-N6)-dimethylallyltransferase MiaA [Candidatus Paceibacterota bacterium]|nr:tRNA (adenosine(37)-N6)-dimethylallyltransferase MiaA [Candidatus Paceibacterota bacterium]